MRQPRKKWPILLAIVVFFAGAARLSAQEELFAFIDTGGEDRYAPPAITSYKYEVARGVFDDLVRAAGNRSKRRPELILNRGKRYMAWMHPGRAQIGVEEAVYDLCTTFGTDSLSILAIILGHELTHYYENHDWSRSFVSNNEGLAASREIAELEEGIKFEAQADYQGGILAISAGYDGYEGWPEFLRRAYKAYNLGEKLDGYPTLTEREKISANAAARLKDIHAVYRTAHYLTLVDQPAAALTYYEHILKDYQGYEVYNNAGACALLAAIDLTATKDFPYTLPVELDPGSRLDRLATRLPDGYAARRAQLLEEAQTFLHQATELTATEPAPYLNRAAAYLLAGEYLDADYWAAKAQAIAQRADQPKTAADAQIVRGIAADLQGRPAEADMAFRRAKADSPLLAEANLNRSTGGMGAAPRARTVPDEEAIGSVFLSDFLEAPEPDRTIVVTEKTLIGHKRYPLADIYLHYVNEGESYTAFHATALDYSAKNTAGIAVGSPLDEVTKAYGKPDRIIALPTGNYLRYDTAGLLFRLDQDDNVRGWVFYIVEN